MARDIPERKLRESTKYVADLICLHEKGSLRKAAKAMGYSNATVLRKRIEQLEALTGLVLAKPGRFEPTRAGLILRDHAFDAFKTFLASWKGGIRSAKSTSVNVALDMSHAPVELEFELRDLLSVISDRTGLGVENQLIDDMIDWTIRAEGSAGTALQKLNESVPNTTSNDPIDDVTVFAIVSEPVLDPNLEQLPFSGVRRVLIATEGTPAARMIEGVNTAQDFRSARWIIRSRDYSAVAIIDGLAKGRPSDLHIVADNYELLQMVRQSDGLAVVPMSLVHDAVERGGQGQSLVYREVSVSRIATEKVAPEGVLLWRKGSPISTTKWFRDFLECFKAHFRVS